ncbi:MAG: hypothetical protein QM538_05785 [Methylacidiphilales bacterium]|nr:hypothetical protein [Candidatus Methylacidiphilales bacterium]
MNRTRTTKNQHLQHAKTELNESSTGRQCHNCGWKVSSTADICENCAIWLLLHKCNFCYTEFEEGTNFCSECGNPPQGIQCPTCHTISHFDFCAKCATALTAQAHQTLLEVSRSIQNPPLPIDNGIAPAPVSILNQAKKSPSFVLKEKSTINIAQGDLQPSLATKPESIPTLKEKAKEKEQLALTLLDDTRSKTFATNQEARRFFGAIKVLLPTLVTHRKPIGWLCNAYNCFHPEGPHECEDPSLGGTWQYEMVTDSVITEKDL